MKNKFLNDTLPEDKQKPTEKGKIKLLDVVALTEDIPEHNLKRGEVGTVVEILANGEAFEVEFSDDNGQMYKCTSFPASQLRVIHNESMKVNLNNQSENHINEIRTMNCRKLREVCLANAQELVNSAKLLKGKNHAYIKYHLAVLAMEEVGKAGIFLAEFVTATLQKNDTVITNSIDDHVKKLFWAIFSPLIEQERLTKEYFESNKKFARDIHERRKESLYTNPQNPILPQDRMTEEEANSLVRLCEIRIEMEKGVEIYDVLDESKLEDLQWFLGTSDEPEKRQFIFSNFSLDKLADLKDMYAWIKWLRQEFTKADEESLKLLRQELEKGPVEDVEGNKPKWKLKFRIYSESHSIRQKALNVWNSNSDFINMELKSSKNSSELICELTLPKRVHLKTLWNNAQAVSREFVAALNIATMGLFWWHVDKDTARFYERIWDLDLEDDTEVGIDVFPKLNIEWEHQSLTEDDLKYTRHIMGYIHYITRSNLRYRDALENYLTGLALLSKNDIHLRLEPNAFAYFFMALKTLLLASGDWDGVRDLKVTTADQISEFSPVQNLSNYIEWGMQLEKRDNPTKRITLTEVIDMKICCDVYFHLLAERELIRRKDLADSNEE